MTNMHYWCKYAHLKFFATVNRSELYHNLAVREGGHLDIDTAAQFLT